MGNRRPKPRSESSLFSDTRPCFFKIMLPGSNERLRVPQRFLESFIRSEEVAENVILRGPRGEQWQIKLQRDGDDMYMQNGWENFFQNHLLGDNEFLLFQYTGNMSFDVVIFDKSGCEKTYLPRNSIPEEPAVCQQLTAKRKPGRPRKRPGASCVAEDYQVKRNQREVNSNEEGVLQGASDASNLAESFSSEFPYFVHRLKDFNVSGISILPIPSSFSQMHLHGGRLMKMVLQNGDGKDWVVSAVATSKSHYFSEGWQRFAQENFLKEGEYCVFELVRECEMKVHVFRP